MMRYLQTGCLLVLFFGFFSATAQDTLRKPKPDTTVSVVDLLHSDRFRGKKVDSVTELTMLAGNVRLKQDSTLIYCDSAVINKHNQVMEAFGNVHINDRDSVQVYGQYLVYHIDKKLAILRKKARLTDGKGVLTTEELQYDTRDRIGNYTNGGRIVNGKTIITSKDATYYADLKDVYFKNQVKLRDPQYKLDTDSLLYNTDLQKATFITKTLIKDSSGGSVVTSDGYYDMKNRVASFGKRSVVKDGKGITVTGDEIYTEDSTGKTIVKGNGVYIDTTQKISVLANYMIADKKKNSFLATQHPLMIITQDKDSIYVTADTLLSARMADLHDTAYRDIPADTLKTRLVVNAKDSADIRYLQCFHHVRIFSDSLQAVCDSMFYASRDSVFRLFINPIVWATNTSQVTGDTIYLFTKNKKAERLYVFENAMAVNRSGDSMYNQLKGNTINAWFRDGAIDFMRAKGVAQSIYYAKDESNAIVGVNNAGADIIDMRFVDKELNKVIFRNDPSGTLYPPKQLPEDKKTLRNFRWLDELRPKTRFALFEDAAR